jgi:predicted DNA-binding transcriptional regulator AlpA
MQGYPMTPTVNPDERAASFDEWLALREFVLAKEFAALLRISIRQLFRLRARGDVPAPVSISTNIIRWRAADVRAYLDSLKIRNPRRRREGRSVDSVTHTAERKPKKSGP